MKKRTHKCRLVIETIQQGRTTAAQMQGCSNANQYYDELRDDYGIIRDEWGSYGDAWVKWRYIADTEKAVAFLAMYGIQLESELQAA